VGSLGEGGSGGWAFIKVLFASGKLVFVFNLYELS